MPAVPVTASRATVKQNSPFSRLVLAVAIASTHCAYTWRDDQAELTWGLRLMDGQPKNIIPIATKGDKRRKFK